MSCYIDLDSAKIFNLNQRYVSTYKTSDETVIPNVQYYLMRTKADLLKREASYGIREPAHRLDEGSFRSLFAGMRFKTEFTHIEPGPRTRRKIF